MAHSVLKLSLILAHEEMPVCSISKNSEREWMLQQCKLLVYYEYMICHKRAVDALNRTIKDINSNQCFMGRMVVLLVGDFRQTLLVITRGTLVDQIYVCIKSFTLWVHINIINLTSNMRVQLHNDIQLR